MFTKTGSLVVMVVTSLLFIIGLGTLNWFLLLFLAPAVVFGGISWQKRAADSRLLAEADRYRQAVERPLLPLLPAQQSPESRGLFLPKDIHDIS